MWRGRLNRLGTVIANALLYLVAIVITPMAEAESTVVFAAFWVLLLVSMVIQVGVMISRVHDFGKPGWLMIPWILSALAFGAYPNPIVTVMFFAIAVPLVLWPGEKDENRWGAPGIGFTRYWKRIVGRY